PICRSNTTLATAQTVSGPSIQGFGCRSLFHSMASTAPPGSSTASHGHLTGAGGGASTAGRLQVNSAGTISTTRTTRVLCAAATLAGCAAWRLARLTISLAPPGRLAKNAVARSVPLRSRTKMPIRLSSRVPRAPASITPRCCNTCCITSWVKCRPMALAINHCPVARPCGASWSMQPPQRTAITASSEPMIQGRGQPIRLARQPPTAPNRGASHQSGSLRMALLSALAASSIRQLSLLLGAFAPGAPDRQNDHQRHQAPDAPGDRAGEQNAEIAVGDRQGATQVLLHQPAEDEAQ